MKLLAMEYSYTCAFFFSFFLVVSSLLYLVRLGDAKTLLYLRMATFSASHSSFLPCRILFSQFLCLHFITTKYCVFFFILSVFFFFPSKPLTVFVFLLLFFFFFGVLAFKYVLLFVLLMMLFFDLRKKKKVNTC